MQCPGRLGVKVTKAPFVHFSVSKIFYLAKVPFWITFIFVRCHRSWAATTPVEYKRDIQWLTYAFSMLKNWENSGAEKIGLITPTPGLGRDDVIARFVFIHYSDATCPGPSNHRQLDYVFNSLFRPTTEKTPNHHIAVPSWRESTDDWWLPYKS